MNWSNKSLSFLGLNKTEVKILDSLSVALNHQDIANAVSIPRTTAAFITKRLMEKGLVLPVMNGKRFRYVALTEEQLSEKLRAMIGEMISTANERKGTQVKISKESEFVVHVGLKDILPAHERIVSLNPDERIFAIQPNKSWMNMHKKLSANQLTNFNEMIRKNNIIIEAIIQQNAYKLYGIFFKKDPKALKTIAESFTDRMADYASVSEKYFDYHAELWIFKDTVMIINWEEEIAVEIQNQNITGFIKDMFKIVKETGAKVDHNQAMKDLLANV